MTANRLPQGMPHLLPVWEGPKVCPSCHRTKRYSLFGDHPKGRLGLRRYCKACRAKRRRKDYAAHRESERAKAAAHRIANRGRLLEQEAKYRAAHRRRLRVESAKWKRSHPEACAVMAARRDARKANAPGDGVTVRQWKAILAASLGLCAYCYERKRLSMDHVVALAHGGEHDITNIAAACRSCNSSKGHKGLLEWLVFRARYHNGHHVLSPGGTSE